MPEVTEIRPGHRGSKRRRVYLDGDEWRALPAEVVADAGLRVGCHVEMADIERRIDEALPVRAWERALRLLTFRERGTGELARRLADDGYPGAVVDVALDRARDLGFLDDRRFADALVRGLTTGRMLGRRRVARELEVKGVDPALSAEMLEAYCGPELERDRACALAARLSSACRGESARLAKRLVNKGYEGGVAWEAARDECGGGGESVEQAP